MTEVFRVWIYLSSSPLLWLTVTVGTYCLTDWLSARLGRPPLANPVLLSVILIVVVLRLTRTEYRVYFAGAQFVHFMLGPATVALAVPLVSELQRIRQLLVPLVAALFAGSSAAIISAILVARAMGASHATLLSIGPKSTTVPIAMSISQTLGGVPAVTAICVMATGILGAVWYGPLVRLLRLEKDEIAAGFAAGVSAHGVGTARALQASLLAGAFAGLGLGLNGLMTTLLVPLLAPYLVR